jgi:hypothetical protein
VLGCDRKNGSANISVVKGALSSAWSKDSSAIYYVKYYYGKYYLYRYSLCSKKHTRIGETPHLEKFDIADDGVTIVYGSVDGSSIIVEDIATQRKVTVDVIKYLSIKPTEEKHRTNLFYWISNNTILFTYFTSDKENSGVYTIEADGRNMVKLPILPYDTQISLDRKFVLYAGNDRYVHCYSLVSHVDRKLDILIGDVFPVIACYGDKLLLTKYDIFDISTKKTVGRREEVDASVWWQDISPNLKWTSSHSFGGPDWYNASGGELGIYLLPESIRKAVGIMN